MQTPTQTQGNAEEATVVHTRDSCRSPSCHLHRVYSLGWRVDVGSKEAGRRGRTCIGGKRIGSRGRLTSRFLLADEHLDSSAGTLASSVTHQSLSEFNSTSALIPYSFFNSFFSIPFCSCLLLKMIQRTILHRCVCERRVD